MGAFLLLKFRKHRQKKTSPSRRIRGTKIGFSDIPRLQRIHELDRQREKYAGDLQQAEELNQWMDGLMAWLLKHERQIGSFPQVI